MQRSASIIQLVNNILNYERLNCCRPNLIENFPRFPSIRGMYSMYSKQPTNEEVESWGAT